MKANVLKFKNDIKELVSEQKKNGYASKWMHPIYCAYYILKHGTNAEETIKIDTEKSYKALSDDWNKQIFKKQVLDTIKEYEEIVCADRENA